MSSILLPLDGSALAEAVLGPASELANMLGASLFLLRVVWQPHHAAYEYIFDDPSDETQLPEATAYLEATAARIRHTVPSVELRATFGLPHLTIARIASEIGAGVIAMATHGRGGANRVLLGSIAAATLQRADVPLLLVRVGAASAAELVSAEPSGTATTEGHADQLFEVRCTRDELEALIGAVGHRLHGEAVDPRAAVPAQLLLGKLRAARLACGEFDRNCQQPAVTTSDQLDAP